MERWTIREMVARQHHCHINSGGMYPGSWGKLEYIAMFDLEVETVKVIPPAAMDVITREHFPSIQKGIERGWNTFHERGQLVTSLLIEIVQIHRHPPDHELRGSSHGSSLFSGLIREYGVPGPHIEPEWLVWNGRTIPNLARTIHTEGDFDRLPILADALEDADCTDPDLLGHLRGPGPHGPRCWVLDLILDTN